MPKQKEYGSGDPILNQTDSLKEWPGYSHVLWEGPGSKVIAFDSSDTAFGNIYNGMCKGFTKYWGLQLWF